MVRKKSSGNPIGAKTKYTPEVVKIMCDAIAKHGGCQAGWEAGKIAKSTFFDWKNKHPDFSDRIAQAEREYRENLPEEQVRQAKKVVADYLFGRVEEVWVSEETIDDPEKGRITKRSVKRVNRGTPQWIINRVLGTGLDRVELIKGLCEIGAVSPEMAQLAEATLNKASSSIVNAIMSGEPLTDED